MTYFIPSPAPEVEGTQIPAWDPINGYIIDVANRWGPRAEYGITGIVDKGADEVMAMARAYERIDADYAFYQQVRAAMPEAPVVANKHGDTPGAPGYVDWSIGMFGSTDDQRVCYQNGDYDGDRSEQDGEVWYTNGGDDVDVIKIPVGHATVDRVVAAMRYMAEKHRAQYVYPHSCHDGCNPGNCEVAHRNEVA